MGLGSCFSALRQPQEAHVDTLEATLSAGLAAADADANARGHLCVIHALACSLAALRSVAFPVAARVLLPVVLRCWAEQEEAESVRELAEAMLGPAPSAPEALPLGLTCENLQDMGFRVQRATCHKKQHYIVFQCKP